MSEVYVSLGVGVQGTLYTSHPVYIPLCFKDQQSLTRVIFGCGSLWRDRLGVWGSDILGSSSQSMIGERCG